MLMLRLSFEKRLWHDLSQIPEKRHGARELIGDFNAIKRLSEKKKRGEAHLFLAAALRISSAKVKWSH